MAVTAAWLPLHITAARGHAVALSLLINTTTLDRPPQLEQHLQMKDQ